MTIPVDVPPTLVLPPDLTDRELAFVILNAGDKAGFWTWISTTTDGFLVLLDGKVRKLTAKHVSDLATRHFLTVCQQPAALAMHGAMD